MKGFFLGLLVAAAAFFVYLTIKQGRFFATAPPSTLTADAGVRPAKVRKRRRARGATRVSSAPTATASGERIRPTPSAAPPPEPEDEPEPVRLSASDLRAVRRGDDLSRPDVLRLDMNDAHPTRELEQADFDDGFRPQEGAILDCIGHARPDPETYVPGRVTIRFRIQRSGAVRGVEVEAPSILQSGGLYECVRGVVGKLRFPASGSSQIVAYPFTLS